MVFQSTHPVRGATTLADNQSVDMYISIHAPREGCDIDGKRYGRIDCDFNPRTP